MKNFQILISALAALLITVSALAQEFPTVRFSKDFPGANIGKIEAVAGSETTFRAEMVAQHDELDLNRQATWFAFDLEPRGGTREIHVVFWNFDGCYNGRPTRPSWKGALPVFSTDEGRNWTHFPRELCVWNEDDRTMTLTVRFPEGVNSLRVAYTAMYTNREICALADSVKDSPRVRQETLGAGQTLFTVTDFTVPEAEKRRFFIMARQHAWEAHTSWQTDGLIRWLAGQKGIFDDAPVPPEELCRKCVFYIVPIVDPLGAEKGWVRFNFLGYDVNRRWNEVDLNSEESRKTRPECWFIKKKILELNAEKPLTLVVNLHGDTATDYIDACGPEALHDAFRAFENRMIETNHYDPPASRRVHIILTPDGPEPPTTFALWWDQRIPTIMMEEKVSENHRLGRFRTASDSQKRGVWLGINLEKTFNQ